MLLYPIILNEKAKVAGKLVDVGRCTLLRHGELRP